MTTNIQRLNDYNRFTTGYKKEAGLDFETVSGAAHMLGHKYAPGLIPAPKSTHNVEYARRAPLTRDETASYLYSLLDARGQAEVQALESKTGCVNLMDIVAVGALHEGNPLFKATIIRSAYEEANGKKTLFGQLKGTDTVVKDLSVSFAKTLRDPNAKKEALKLQFIPAASDKFLADMFDASKRGDSTTGAVSFRGSNPVNKPVADTVASSIERDSAGTGTTSHYGTGNAETFKYLMPAMAVGAPLALLGGLAGGTSTGLGILGAAGIAGLGYGIAKNQGWKGIQSINSGADAINGAIGFGKPTRTKGSTTPVGTKTSVPVSSGGGATTRATTMAPASSPASTTPPPEVVPSAS